MKKLNMKRKGFTGMVMMEIIGAIILFSLVHFIQWQISNEYLEDKNALGFPFKFYTETICPENSINCPAPFYNWTALLFDIIAFYIFTMIIIRLLHSSR